MANRWKKHNVGASLLLGLCSSRTDGFLFPPATLPSTSTQLWGQDIMEQDRELYLDKLQKSRSADDFQMEQWYREQGILGTSRVSLCSSNESVGGRGLFWVGKNEAEAGDMIAYIPSKYVIAPSNALQVYPDLAASIEMNESKSKNDIPWQSKLTTFIGRCLDEASKDEDRSEDANDLTLRWKEWISSWSGGGPSAARPSNEYSQEELKYLADSVGCSLDAVREAIDSRHVCFKRDWELVKDFYKFDEEHFGYFYSIIVSRVAKLGSDWQDEGGIIPLHDMTNHPPYYCDPNIELFCIGNIRHMIGDENFTIMFQDLLDDANDEMKLRDDDILLVASRNIEPGEELWLKYKDRGDMEERDKLWLMLQYGFPFHM
uniref:SET domain-containing protein n=1 Tax=Chaetoceros debilis TaxID=122233 RepID=A0A7S3PTX5_9STRA